MAIAKSVVFNELHILREDLAAIPQVQQVSVYDENTTASLLSVVIVLDEYNREAEKKIIDIESNVMEASPWLDVDFDVVYLSGRPVSEVVSPKGFLLFAR